MLSDEKRIPTPDEIQKDFEDFIKDKYGGSVRLFTSEVHQGGGGHQLGPIGPIGPQEENKKSFSLDFDYRPKDIKEYLDRFVVQQDEAKKALAIAVCDHYNHVRECHKNSETNKNYAKQNVVMLGPTGVGKTYLVRQIANLIGVPFVKADATRFSETGYVGANVDDLIRDLVTQADGDLELAQYGIVYLDEADKIATPKNVMGKDVTGRGVQIGLLKLMEESEVDLNSGNDMASQMQAFMEFQKKGRVEKKVINTRHILFIVSGVFNGLKDVVKKRMNVKTIGFDSNPVTLEDEEDFLKYAGTKDFVDIGFEPEFIGRLPVRVVCNSLSADDLFTILRDSEGSIANQYRQAFRAYNIEAQFSEDGLKEIARKAFEEKTGARGLMTVCERTFRHYKFELPSSHIREFSVDQKMVEDPPKALEDLLQQEKPDRGEVLVKQIRDFEREFQEGHGLTISFDEETTRAICELCNRENREATDVLTKALRNYEHGLNIVKQNTGQSAFTLPMEILKDSQSLLEQMIRRSYPPKEDKETETSE
jgi:endopeptidase Clp ATP-binding regulatory subunit ClpX